MKTLLIVEDSPQDELPIRSSLRKAALANSVDGVRDGRQALDWLEGEGEFAARPAANACVRKPLVARFAAEAVARTGMFWLLTGATPVWRRGTPGAADARSAGRG